MATTTNPVVSPTDQPKSQRGAVAVIFICALLFSIFTVAEQVRAIGFDRFVEGGWQVQNIQRDLSGTAGNPWQYRILSPWLVDKFAQVVKGTGLPYPSANAYIIFRLVQNILIFVFAGFYYQKLGLNLYAALVALSILAWSMSHALQYSDLQFNTYMDVLFYMLAGLIIAHEQYAWIIPVTLFAAFNRETSAFIPLLPVVACIQFKPKITVPRRILIISGIASAVYLAAFLFLRYRMFGPQELNIPYGQHMGMELFWYNVSQFVTYLQLFATMTVLPVLAIITLPQWPELLRRLFWLIVPIWFVIHLFGSVMAETRLFLVPLALIIIPGVIFGLLAQGKAINQPSTPDPFSRP